MRSSDDNSVCPSQIPISFDGILQYVLEFLIPDHEVPVGHPMILSQAKPRSRYHEEFTFTDASYAASKGPTKEPSWIIR